MPINSITSHSDDTTIFSTGVAWTEVENKINCYLEKVSVWLAFNKLTLNIKKTVYIDFDNYCDSVPLNINRKIINMNGKIINMKIKAIKVFNKLTSDLKILDIINHRREKSKIGLNIRKESIQKIEWFAPVA